MADRDPETGKFVSKEMETIDLGAGEKQLDDKPKPGDFRTTEDGKPQFYVSIDGKGDWVDSSEAAKGYMRLGDYHRKMNALRDTVNLSGANATSGARTRLGINNPLSREAYKGGVEQTGKAGIEKPGTGEPSEARPFRAQRDEEVEEEYALRKEIWETKESVRLTKMEAEQELAEIRSQHTSFTQRNELTEALNSLYAAHDDFDEQRVLEASNALSVAEQQRLQRLIDADPLNYPVVLENIYLKHVKGKQVAETVKEDDLVFGESSRRTAKDFTSAPKQMSAAEVDDEQKGRTFIESFNKAHVIRKL